MSVREKDACVYTVWVKFRVYSLSSTIFVCTYLVCLTRACVCVCVCVCVCGCTCVYVCIYARVRGCGYVCSPCPRLRWLQEPLLHTANVDPQFDPLRPNQRLEYCDLCENWKPTRTHHCSRCGHCVPRMDHHCPWTRNCVGFENQKYFLVFILWCCWTLLLVFSVGALDLYTALSVRHASMALAFQDMEVYLSLVITVYSGGLLFGPVGAIGAVQLFGVLANVTRLELQEFLRMAGEFDTWPYGVDWLENTIQVGVGVLECTGKGALLCVCVCVHVCG
jgi:DHHC palmitoyltransferase